MNISDFAIKHFLDSVDIVLNSNTFIVEFDIPEENIEDALKNFLLSDNFMAQLAERDIEREWFCLHYFDDVTNNYRLKQGNPLEKNIQLKIDKPSFEKREYLIAMLTGDTSKGPFFSFYQKEIERDKAEMVVDNLINYLTLYTNKWDLFIVEPDFLKSTDKSYPKGEELRYFEGDFGNDTATIIRYKNKGYLILTNGID